MTPISAQDASNLLGITIIELARVAKAYPSVKIQRGVYNQEALLAIENIPEAIKEGQKLYKADFYKKNKTKINAKSVAYQKKRYHTDEEYKEKRLSLSAASRVKRSEK